MESSVVIPVLIARQLRRLARISFAFLLLAASSLPLSAQTNVNEEQGIKPHDSLHGGDLDTVGLINGGLSHHIPLASFPQRGNLGDLTFSIFATTKQWTIYPDCYPDTNGDGGETCNFYWIPLPRGGQMPSYLQSSSTVAPPQLYVQGAYVASSVDMWLQSHSQAEPIDPNNPSNQTLYDWNEALIAPDGNIHQFGSMTGSITAPQLPMRSLDATGILYSNGNTVILPNGANLSYNGGGSAQGSEPSAVTDANGNQITISSSAWTDSMGRVIPGPTGAVQPGTATSNLSACPSGTSSASTWTIPGFAGVNSGLRTFIFCFSTISIYTNFGNGATEYPSTNTTLLTAVVLPDLSLWTFTYDHLGDITQVGLPTGGTISYTYAVGPTMCLSGSVQQSMVVTSRTVNANDGTGSHTWNYAYSGQATSSNGKANYSGTTVVTSPDGNDAVHTITNPVPGQECSLYDTQVQILPRLAYQWHVA